MSKSTANRSTRKAKKPHPDFPLFPHASGRWAKKVRGQFAYFGKVEDDPKGKAALSLWLEQKDDLLAGRKPVAPDERKLSLADMVNHFLSDADERRESGDLSALSFRDYRWTGERMVEHFGRSTIAASIKPTDFAKFRHKLARRYAPSRLGKTVTVTRMMFKWAFESELIDTMPRFGPSFKASTKRATRLAKSERHAKLFSSQEVRQLVKQSSGTLSAMILLAINGGLGNTDLSSLPVNAVDLDGGWINFPRPKTGVDRRVPLWPETVDALSAVMANRPEPQTDELGDRVFLTTRGGEWVVIRDDGRRVDKIATRFRRLLDDIDAHAAGRGFYSLRHTFQTVGDEAGDPIATSHIMGHVDASIAGTYRERISDERLRKVTSHVREWLALKYT